MALITGQEKIKFKLTVQVYITVIYECKIYYNTYSKIKYTITAMVRFTLNEILKNTKDHKTTHTTTYSILYSI